MEAGLIFGIVTGLVIAFLIYKAIELNKTKKPAAPADPKKSGGGYTSDNGLGELPKTGIK